MKLLMYTPEENVGLHAFQREISRDPRGLSGEILGDRPHHHRDRVHVEAVHLHSWNWP